MFVFIYMCGAWRFYFAWELVSITLKALQSSDSMYHSPWLLCEFLSESLFFFGLFCNVFSVRVQCKCVCMCEYMHACMHVAQALACTCWNDEHEQPNQTG